MRYSFSTSQSTSASGSSTSGGGGLLGNLHVKWPAPIQNVTRYDARVQVLETQLEETQTQDHYAIVPSLYVAWRIDDGFKFHKQVRGDVSRAEKQIIARLRNAQAEITRYTFDQLTNSDPAQLNAIFVLIAILLFGGANGAFAEYVCAREDALAPKPANLSFEEAAAVPLAAVTALQALRDHGKIQPV